MNRFEYAQAVLRDDETFVAKHKGMKLYHGHQKVYYKIIQFLSKLYIYPKRKLKICNNILFPIS